MKPLNINIWNSFKIDLIFTNGMEYKKQSSQHYDSHDSSEHFLKFAPWSKILSYRGLGHFPMKTFGSRDNVPAQIRSIGENILSWFSSKKAFPGSRRSVNVFFVENSVHFRMKDPQAHQQGSLQNSIVILMPPLLNWTFLELSWFV